MDRKTECADYNNQPTLKLDKVKAGRTDTAGISTRLKEAIKSNLTI